MSRQLHTQGAPRRALASVAALLAVLIAVCGGLFAPVAERGGLGGAYNVFHGRLEPLLDELNQALVA